MRENFGHRSLADAAIEPAPDGSEVAVLLRTGRGSMAHFELAAGQVSAAIAHSSVEELWYVLAGSGLLWRRSDACESVTALEPGVCVDIPARTHFQFRAQPGGALRIIAVTMPPWPGEGDARAVPGRWSANTRD